MPKRSPTLTALRHRTYLRCPFSSDTEEVYWFPCGSTLSKLQGRPSAHPFSPSQALQMRFLQLMCEWLGYGYSIVGVMFATMVTVFEFGIRLWFGFRSKVMVDIGYACVSPNWVLLAANVFTQNAFRCVFIYLRTVCFYSLQYIKHITKRSLKNVFNVSIPGSNKTLSIVPQKKLVWGRLEIVFLIQRFS